jgi:uncharacterized protein involved in response to NO
MLHAAYVFIPVGLATTGAAAIAGMSPAAGLHLLGIGAIGGMTVAVMMRATRGHTGREMIAGGWLAASFVLVAAAALARAAAPWLLASGVDAMALSAASWTIGFAIFAVRIASWLALPRAVASRASGAPQ